VAELALFVPLSVAMAWNHSQMRRATSEHHWTLIHHRRKVRSAAIVLTVIIALMNFESPFGVLGTFI